MTSRTASTESPALGGLRLLTAALIVAGVAYGLNRGTFLYSTVGPATDALAGTYHYRTCRYLFASGVVTLRKGGWLTEADAANEFCPLFHH